MKKFFIGQKIKANRNKTKHHKFSSKNIAFLMEETTDVEKVETLFKANFGNEYHLHFAVFSKRKLQQESPLHLFTKDSFSFLGGLKRESLQSLAQEKFLYVFNLFPKDKFYLNYLTSLLRAKLSIGFQTEDNEINDLSIKTSVEELEVFFKEAKNYLSLINKSS